MLHEPAATVDSYTGNEQGLCGSGLGDHGRGQEFKLLHCALGFLKAPTHTSVHTPDEEVLTQVFHSLWRAVG
jgi:hypothetical protein